MNAAAAYPTLIAWSVVLLLVYVTAQAALALREKGIAWGAGSRGDGGPDPDGAAGRAGRALRNFGETYPAFVALALALAVKGVGSGAAMLGAQVWLGSRALYLPTYVAGVPYLRTLLFQASVVGLVLMLAPLL